MPKKLIEINKFHTGIKSTPSQTDIEIDAARYSLNIDPTATQGRLQGIDRDRPLTATGWGTQGIVQGNINNIILNYKGTTLSDVGTPLDNPFMNYGDGIAINNTSEHNVGATIHSMYDGTVSHTSAITNINNGTEFQFGSIGATANQALNLGNSLSFFMFDNDNVFQNILNVHKAVYTISATEYIRYIFNDDNRIIRQNAENVSSYPILYPRFLSWAPGGALMFQINDKFIYFYLTDTDNPEQNYDPKDFLRTPDGFNSGSNEWGESFAGSYPIAIDFNRIRTCNTNDTNIRNIIFAEIRSILLSPAFGWNSIFNSITHTKTAYFESLEITPRPEKLFNFSFLYNLFGMSGYAPFIFGVNNGLELTYTSDYFNQIYPSPNSPSPIEINLKQFKTVPDKTNKNSLNLIGLSSGADTSYSGESDTLGTSHISVIKDIYNYDSVSIDVLGHAPSNGNEYDLLEDDDKVHVALGPGEGAKPKVVMTPSDNPLTGDIDENTLGMFDSALTPPMKNSLSGLFEYVMTPPIHGYEAGSADDSSTFDKETPISHNDTLSTALGVANSKYGDHFWADYDIELDNTSSLGYSLYTALQDGGTLANLKVGQIFRVKGTNDFNDAAMVVWKKYDYNAQSTAVVAKELYMFCGYYGNTVPILRFIGLQATVGGTPAFSYAIKNSEKSIFKISLIDEDVDDKLLFDESSTSTLKDKDAQTVTVTNVGKRITELSISGLGLTGYISSIHGATSPTLFNRVGLAGEGESYAATTAAGTYQQNVYWNNGHLRILYRHGVFWIADSANTVSIFRLNAIDFHELSGQARMEQLNLDFSMIPSQLHAENGEGIIRRTIEDKHREKWSDGVGNGEVCDSLDPKAQKGIWSRIPQDAEIIGICETWESGAIDNRDGQNNSGGYVAYTPEDFEIPASSGSIFYKLKACRFQPHDYSGVMDQSPVYSATTVFANDEVPSEGTSQIPIGLDFGPPQWRLTTGDVVRFAGLSATSKVFNTGPPRTVNVVDDGYAILINGDDNNVANSPYFLPPNHMGTVGDANQETSNYNDHIWFNCKVWILYGKKTTNLGGFKDWDLFLYNANTIDIDEASMSFRMADRTVPFVQARWHETFAIGDATQNIIPRPDLPNNKIHYPGDAAFLHRGHGADTEDAGFNSPIFDDEYSLFLDWGKIAPDLKAEGLTDDIRMIREPCSNIGEFDVWITNQYGNPNQEAGLGLLESAQAWSVFGIYDKAGRWTNNGDHQYHAYGDSCADSINNRRRYNLRDNNGFVMHPEEFGIDGEYGSPMIWGNNIGWEVNLDSPNETRVVKNISGSLHAKNPYSGLYNGNRMYIQRFPTSDDGNFGPETAVNETLSMPTHAVTFLSKVTGKFVAQPNKISRVSPAFAAIGSQLNFYGDGWGVFRYLSQFCAGGEYGEHYQAIKSYDDSLTLFTIDDFSGHRGSVLYSTSGGDDPTKLESSGENSYVSGIAMGRPNIGGPEIENPFYFRYAIADTGLFTGTRWPFSSLNGGYSTPEESHSTDGGWEGYTPPRLGAPGRGYYVYMNRRWKNQNLTNQINEDFNFNVTDYWNGIAIDNDNLDLGNGHIWNFQQDSGADNDNFFHSNRRHNFSSTCIGDNIITNLKAYTYFNWPTNQLTQTTFTGPNDSPITTVAFDYDNDHSLWGEHVIDQFSEFQAHMTDSWRFRSKVTRFAHWDEDINHDNDRRLMTTFSCNESPMAVCTMHDIDSTNIGEINNCYPVIFKSNRGYDAPIGDFNVSYVCGIQSTDVVPKSGMAIIRTNQDSNWKNMLYSTRHGNTVHGNSHDPARFINGWQQAEQRPMTPNIKWMGMGSGTSGSTSLAWMFWDTNESGDAFPDTKPDSLYATKNVGTHFAEIISLTDQQTYFDVQVGIEIGKLKMRQLATTIFSDNVISDGLVSFTLKPMIPEYPNAYNDVPEFEDSDTYVGQVLSAGGDRVFLGTRDEHFMPDKGVTYSDNPDVMFPTGGYYMQAQPFDSGGKFLVGDFFENENDEDIWSKTISFMSTEYPEAVLNGPLEAGKYFYKIAFEYDGAYESPLPSSNAASRVLPVIENEEYGYNYIQILLQMSSSVLQQLSPRVTGLSVYRRQDGMEDDNYYFVENVKFSDKRWSWNGLKQKWQMSIYDNGTFGPSYSALNGIDQTIEDTSLSYGLMARHQGYLYVTQASHSKLKNVNRYIFRSQPNNFFAFNWVDDWVIMPEVPIAMTAFNSRLYVWGKKKLYKVDPFSLIIEEEYEGISISGKDAYVKTEFGLCFMDKNNIYIHDGNRPNPIGEPILYASEKLVGYETHSQATDGYVLIQQGYRELVKQTLDNGDNPTIFYLGRKNSFVINLSDKSRDGRGFVFNLVTNRWDLWDAPRPKSVSTGQDADILINDGSVLWNYIDAESILYTKYLRRLWTWVSKDLTFGVNTQDKIFRGLTFLGTPSVFNFSNNAVTAHSNDASVTNAIQAFIDDEPVNLTIKNKFYELTNLGDTYLTETINDTTALLNIATSLDDLSINGGVTTGTKTQNFIRPGQLIKLDDEIVLVTATSDYTTYVQLTVIRAQMGTTAASHTGAVTTNHVAIVSPQLQFDSGTKGKKLSVRLFEQAGYIDSIAISYKQKGVKL